MGIQIDADDLIMWIDCLVETIEDSSTDVKQNPYLSMYISGTEAVRDRIIEMKVDKEKGE